MKDPLSTFLHEHKRIESWLRQLSGHTTRLGGFSDMLHKQAAHHPALRRHESRLRVFNELRNAIVHLPGPTERPLAQPLPEVVEEIRDIADLLTKPPQVPRRVFHAVRVFALDESIGSALTFMHRKGFSQVPVAQQGGFAGLLTLGTVSRWLAANVKDDLADLTVTLKELLTHQERNDHWCFMSSKANCAEVFDAFCSAQERARPIDAVLLSDNGKQSIDIKGIVTNFDLPDIARALRIG